MTFNEIKNKKLSELNVLKEADKYFAHTPGYDHKKEKEFLKNHIQLVEYYTLKLIKIHNLETIIDNLINGFLQKESNPDLFSFAKTLFFNSFIYHDLGKINPLFQWKKMKNPAFEQNLITSELGSNHSSLSGYLFLMHHLQVSEKYNLNENCSPIIDFLIMSFSIPICKHHGSHLDIDSTRNIFSREKLLFFQKFLQEFNVKINKENLGIFHTILEVEIAFKRLNELKANFDFFALFSLIKLNFSLLTASDYYATAEYMNNIRFDDEDFGLLDQKLKQHLRQAFISTKNFNKKLFMNTEYYQTYPISKLQNVSKDNLNVLRQKLVTEVISGIEKYKDVRVFYIVAPTGGGKTNMSMAAAIKLLEQHEELNKIFYVFPFTTLVTQTFSSIIKTLKLSNQYVTQVHSKAGFQSKTNSDEEQAEYGAKLKNQIDNLFVNYPITLMTHVKFFDILKSNKKESNYLLHRLANSIVIIDELQAYDPKHWDKIKFFISNYAYFFNIRFIIMSATLPEIGSITLSNKELLKFEHLIPDARKKYLQNPNFSKRVNFSTELLNKNDLDIPKLAEISCLKSENYAKERTDSAKGSVFTIIEFIFKKSATEFYEHVIKNKQFLGYEIFVLSGTIIEPRRKEIINFIKDERNRSKKVLLITTQVVEAGVDIDMDLGFKNQSLPDSDEQLAGRINRNVKKNNCDLYLFRINEPKTIYGKDYRYKIALNYSPLEIKKLLQEKNFKELYDQVIKRINTEEIKKSGKEDFTEYLNSFKKLKFNDIDREFRLIESESSSIFVPVDIDVLNYQFQNEKDNNFEEEEIRFIKENDCYVDKKELKVSGEKIWNLHLQLVQNKNLNFTTKIKDLKVLNGIMSKFVFTVFTRNINDLKEYLEYNEDNHDFKHLKYYKLSKQNIGYDKIYDYYGGLNVSKIKKSYDIF